MTDRPEESEYTPFARGYVNGVEGAALVPALNSQLSDFVTLAAALDDSYRYAPGKWTVKELVGHVNDTERIFAYRTLCVGRGDQTPFPGFEQDDYIAGADFNNRTLADLLEEFRLIRESSLCLVRQMPARAWLRRGTVSGYSVTARGVAWTLAGHERHHYRILREKYS